MFQNLSLRSKLIALTTPPLAVLGAFVVYAIQLRIRGGGSDIESDVSTLGILALAAFMMTALVGISIARAVSQPLSQATDAARELSQKRLPQLLETLRNPGSPAPVFEPLECSQNDEFGDLVRALNEVQASAADLAAEQQSLVRAGLQDLVVNMARRNQSLLDRQIEVIDRMEATEEDPDRLEDLYSLDHLATRMKRNAESLLVLAGAEPGRRRGGPVAVADVLRVAMSEIEDYQHVELEQIEETKIGPQGAVDLAHLTSELLENATQFSPPDAQVLVRGVSHPGGSYLISISDKGIGLNEDQLLAANSVLSSPPELGLGLTRSLGFIVVGRLAKRLGVRVEIASDAGGGTTAIIEVPASVLHGYQAPETPTGPEATQTTTAIDAVQDSAAEGVVLEPADRASSLSQTSVQSEMPATVDGLASAEASDTQVLGVDGLADNQADEESWTPPAMPERGLSPLSGAPVSQGQTSPADAQLQPRAEPTDTAPGTSDALAKLLGIDPFANADSSVEPTAPLVQDHEAFSAEQATESAFASPDPISNLDPSDPWGERTGSTPPVSDPLPDNESAATPRDTESLSGGPDFGQAWTPPAFDPQEPEIQRVTEETAAHASFEPPQKLTDAIGTADSFDSGVAELLRPPPETTTSGLVKRDRTTSQAPTSEGRPVAASVRSPEEIRSMLARYRDGLKGRSETTSLQDAPALQTALPTEEPVPAPQPATQSPDAGSDESPFSQHTNPLDSNPFGDPS